MRKIEQYSVKDGKTPLSGEELSQRFLDIDGRLHQLELLKVSWEEAVALVQNHGLDRINNTIQPVLDQANILVADAQTELDAIKTQWQDILGEWDSVADTLTVMQASLDAMQAEIDAAEAAIAAANVYTDTQIAAAIPVAPIQLINWQTDPDQYSVLAQDASDSDGEGQDIFYKYVFPADALSTMYTQALLPFAGYDLQFCFPYRMSSSATGSLFWQVQYRVVSTNAAYAEIANWTAFWSTSDAGASRIHTPSATANQRNLISGSNIVIPSSAYSAYETLQIAFFRNGLNASDTHSGNAEVDDSILLVPVLA